MEIILGIGIENIKFGASQNDIETILGKPDKISKDEEYGEFEPMLQYNSRHIRLTFYKNHEGRLGYIRSSNPDLAFNKKKIIGKTIPEAFKIFDIIPQEKWEVTEYDFWTEYFNEDWWIILRCDYDLISEIELGVPFKNDNEYNWPKQ
jgi:hypothetical protein